MVNIVQNKDLPKNKATIAHIAGLMFGPVGSLLFYIFGRNKFTMENARNATNWQASLLIYIATISLLFSTSAPYLILTLLVLNLIFVADASLSALDGKAQSYVLALPILRKEEQTSENDSDKIERIKNLYVQDHISKEELEERIEDAVIEEQLMEQKSKTKEKQKV